MAIAKEWNKSTVSWRKKHQKKVQGQICLKSPNLCPSNARNEKTNTNPSTAFAPRSIPKNKMILPTNEAILPSLNEHGITGSMTDSVQTHGVIVQFMKGPLYKILRSE